MPLPSDAVPALRLQARGDALEVNLELAGTSAVSRAFSLRNPSQLVLDIDGAAPSAQQTVAAGEGVAEIELLPHGDRTRLRLTLERPIERISTEGGRVIAYLAPRVAPTN